MGYTINRVSLFALIFSIGILVDDAIVVIENIAGIGHGGRAEHCRRRLKAVARWAIPRSSRRSQWSHASCRCCSSRG